MADRRVSELIELVRVAPPELPPMTDAEFFTLFFHILRDRSIFAEAARLLRPDHFEMTTELHYRVFWTMCLEFVGQYGEPHYASMYLAMQQKLQTDTGLSPMATALLLNPDWNGVLYYALNLPREHLHAAAGQSLLRRFLKERAIINPFRNLLAKTSSRNCIENFNELVKVAASQVEAIDAIESLPTGSVMPRRGEKLRAPDVFVPTGLSHFDNFIRGQRPGDCNGMLGVYGSGKTTQCVALAVQNARNFYYHGYTTGTMPKLSVFMSYEEPEEKLEKRIWSNAAQIPHSKLAELRDWSELTTQANLAPYERQLAGQAAASGLVLSETERWDMAHTWLNASFHMFDMSGSEKYPNAGYGYVDEIVSVLHRLREERGQEIGVVHIDYAKIICQRHIRKNGWNEESKMRHMVGEIGDLLRNKVAVPFRCTVWLMHQFAPDQNKRLSTHALDHSNASESKAFAEHMAVCGCLGVRDQITGCSLLNWSKVRYHPTHGRTMPVVRIDGTFCRMEDVSHQYVVDPTSHSFVDPTTRHQIEGPQVVANPVSSGPEGLSPFDGTEGY